MLITYNGISLPYSETSEFTEESVYDDLSKSDLIATRFVIVTKFLVNINYIKLLSPTIASQLEVITNPAPIDIMQILSRRLREPRKSLSVKCNGRELIPNPIGKNPGTVDAMNGPQPQYCKYTQLTSTTFIIEYKVIAHYVLNFYANQGKTLEGGDYLYNKWEETVALEESGYSKRTRNGEFKIRSDNVKGLIPDMLRTELAVVSIPEGFVRESSRYAQSSDGLTLKYTIVDREVHRFPPPPAHKAEGYYVETGRGFGAAIRRGECYVKLTGAKGTDPAKLMFRAIEVVAAKLKIADVSPEIQRIKNPNAGQPIGIPLPFVHPRVEPDFLFVPKGIPEQIDARINMYQNIVEYRVIARFVGPKRKRATEEDLRVGFTPVPFSALPKGGTQPTYYDRGSAGLLLLAASYHDPVLEDVKLEKQKHSPEPFPEKTTTGKDHVELGNLGILPGEAGKKKEN